MTPGASPHPFLAFLPLAGDAMAPTSRGQFLMRHAHDLVFELDGQGCYRYVSPSHQNWLGWAPSQLLGRAVREVAHPDDAPQLQKPAESLALRLRRSDGTWRRFEGASCALEGGWFIVCHDVSCRDQLEAELGALVAVARCASTRSDLNDLLAAIAPHLQPFLPSTRLLLTLLNETGALALEASHPPGLALAPLSRPAQSETGTGTGTQPTTDGRWRALDSGAPDATPHRLAVPLLTEGRAVGLLHFETDDARQWSENQVRLARLVGEQCAAAVQSAQAARQRSQHEAELAQSNALLHATQEASAEGICLVSDAGEVVSYNRRFAGLWGLGDEEAELRREGRIMAHVLEQVGDADEFIAKVAELFDASGASACDEIPLLDGRVFERFCAPVRADDGRSFGRVWAFSDITQRKEFENRLAHQAYHDAVTGLPNRVLLTDHLERALAKIERTRRMIAVLFLDLDRFKIVNDSLGHEKGDQLLVQVAHRLRQSLRPSDIAARFGGDEFVVLLEEVVASEDATRVADRIADQLRAPFCLDGHEVAVTASIGIVLSASSQDGADDLLRKADVAMYRAKDNGKAQYELFSEQLSGEALERLQLELDLAGALKRGEMRVHYQPLADLRSGRVRAFEALARWQHPRRGAISPAQFIPVAEETGHIVALGAHVLRVACEQAKNWSDALDEPVLMHVNLSVRQFEQPNLPVEIARVLRETGLPPAQLMLEITESAVMTDARGAVAQLEAIKKLGVRVSIDDFGTGYSSLAYLELFPIDLLKIDRTFVARLESGSALVSAIASLGQALGIEVAAEGIETAGQLARLREMGVRWGQGFLISRPVPAADAEVLLSLAI